MTAGRINISSGSPFEPAIGFSRAVKVGAVIAVSGTGPVGADGKTAGAGDPEAQARRCFEISRVALEKAGASLADVVRTRIFLTDIAHWSIVAKVHGELFSAIRPACTVMEVSRFINPEWLIETEVDAVTRGTD